MAKFLVWRPENDQEPEDGRVVDAWNAPAAACVWAEREDSRSADYAIVGGTDATVRVRDVASGDEYEMVVSGESVPSYTARVCIPQPVRKAGA